MDDLLGRGRVRLRSNVTTDPDGKHLVPGEVLARHENIGLYLRRVGRTPFGRRQRMEFLYYTLCSACDRTTAVARLEGCGLCDDQPQEQVYSRRDAYEARIEKARLLEAELNALIADGRGRDVIATLIGHRRSRSVDDDAVNAARPRGRPGATAPQSA